MPEVSAAPLLRDFHWKPLYSHEDGDLVRLFFEPALSRACRYQRATGYFTADVLVLAARGLDALVRRGGSMQLLVGCTLQPAEVEAIDRGYELRKLVQEKWRDKLEPSVDDPEAREKLGWLAWMVAHGHLDIKLAVPKDADGRFVAGLGLYHVKAGLLTDESGDRLLFIGSINETEAGWRRNCESFTVSCSWRGEWDVERIERQAREFEALWSNRAARAEVMEFPEALRRRLLEFLPADDRFLTPEGDGEQPAEAVEAPAEPPPVTPADERRRRVWAYIRGAASRPDGARVAIATSTVEPWPHQLRAYKRMLDTWPCRLLVADEVGLGKTIEAGMLIRHVWISGLAKRILLLVPKAVIRQWQGELYEKFNVLVPIYTGRSLVWPKHHPLEEPREEEVSRTQWARQPLVLASSQLVRRRERRGDLLEAEDWDLVLLDEAHHARRRGAGTKQEKGPNLLLGLMQELSRKTKALLLLTATPMQVHPVEIWDLLHLLGLPPEWTDEAFSSYFERLNQNPDPAQLGELRLLFQACERDIGAIAGGEVQRVARQLGLSIPQREKVLRALRDPKTAMPIRYLTTEERKAAVALLKLGSPVRTRMSRHTRDLLREYHRRGISKTPIAERDPIDCPIELAPDERTVYDAVEDYITTTYKNAAKEKKTAVGFVLTVYRRRLASSFHALRKTLERRLEQFHAAGAGLAADEMQREEDAPEDERADDVIGGDEIDELARAALEAEEEDDIRKLLGAVGRLGTDTKARVLVEQLEQALASGYDSAIVFTQYTDTMEYLKEFLASRLDLPIGCFSGAGGQRRDAAGSWSRCTKEEIKRRLREGAIRILVCTDAAGEGLNLQYCGVLVNYDLPWNPMKVEQRIGRIDRIGQKHERIRVVNLAYRDTVEADVYFSLSTRIDLFRGVVGKVQPILALLPRQFESAVLASPGQRERARHDAVSNVNRLVDEAKGAAFDIDEVSEADLEPPDLPPSPLEPGDVDAVLRRPELLPLGVECRPLDRSTYALRLPGDPAEIRITTSPEVFDQHFESHQLLLADSPAFRRVVELAECDGVEIPAGKGLADLTASP